MDSVRDGVLDPLALSEVVGLHQNHAATSSYCPVQIFMDVPQIQFFDVGVFQFLDKVVFMPVACRQLGSRRAENCAVPQLQFSTRRWTSL